MFKLLLVASMFLAHTLFAAGVASVNKQGVGIEGYDPVSYFKSEKPIKGDLKFKATQGEVTYWFANENNKQEFLKDPKKYEPQFGGWCAFAIADSKSKVEIDPTKFLIQDGRLFLFYNGLWGDTRDKWLNTKNKDTKTFLKDADANWPETKNKEP